MRKKIIVKVLKSGQYQTEEYLSSDKQKVWSLIQVIPQRGGWRTSVLSEDWTVAADVWENGVIYHDVVAVGVESPIDAKW
jgi:hypothetical protein